MSARPPGHVSFVAYRALSAVVEALPSPAATAAASVAGTVATMSFPRSRRLVRGHLERVLGETSRRALDRAVAASFSSYARYWIESARLSSMDSDALSTRFTIEGFEPAKRALEEKRGAIFALPHVGSWEVGGLWLSHVGHPMTTVVEPARSVELSEWFAAKRAALGLDVVPLGPGAIPQLVRVLRSGGLVGLVADRDISGSGIPVEFFGEQTTLPAGPALLSLRTGAPLHAVAVYQLPKGRCHGVVRPCLEIERTGRLREDVALLTKRLAVELEVLIATAPTQWHLFQPNWPSEKPNWPSEKDVPGAVAGRA